MEINLKDNNLFNTDILAIEKNECIIFGNNGTGKSTLVREIKNSQKDNYDVRIFQGFDSVINENKELNAVVLGEENVEIDNKISRLKENQDNILKEKHDKYKKIDESAYGENDLYIEWEDAKKAYDKQYKKVDRFYKKAASQIKELEPKITPSTSYHKNIFKDEIKNAHKLTNEEVNECSQLIRTEIKEAVSINFPDINLVELREKVLNLYNRVIEEQVHISRFEGNSEKRIFAKKGLEIHSEGDLCSFCGNKIEQEVVTDLKRYFSADEVIEFQKKLSNQLIVLKQYQEKIKSLSISTDDFYPTYEKEVLLIQKDMYKFKEEISEFLKNLISLIENKQKNLFEYLDEPQIKIPTNSLKINEYNDLVQKNNDSNLKLLREEAKAKLRFNEIYKHKEDFDYDTKTSTLNQLEQELSEKKKTIDLVKEEISSLDYEVKKINNEITKLRQETLSEKILANRINKTLKSYVGFELVYKENDQNGLYMIKNTENNEYRNVTKLSTGEKNIISFLYFFEKLEDSIITSGNRRQLVIFDDPMTSNDGTMQYIIINVLQNLLKKKYPNKNVEKLFILTHNHHFYLNLINNLYKKYERYEFIRLMSNGFKTTIKKIESGNDDFNTNYAALWYDLKFVFQNEEASPSLLCNTMRRIIETYTKFNSIARNDFYRGSSGAKKFLDVNSHQIEDHTADLIGTNKRVIMEVFKNCFENNNAIDHFNQYCDWI